MSLDKPNSLKTPPNFMRFAATETLKQYLSNPRTGIPSKVFMLENFVKKNTTSDKVVPEKSRKNSK